MRASLAAASLIRHAAVLLSAAQVISDAVASGAVLGFLGGTLSEASELVARNALAQLEPEAAEAIKLFSAGAVKQDERYSLVRVVVCVWPRAGVGAGRRQVRKGGRWGALAPPAPSSRTSATPW